MMLYDPGLTAKAIQHTIDSHALARERKHLLLFAMTRLHDPDLAEDAVQETLASALRSLHHFEQRSSLQTWLISILINKIADLCARRGREIAIEELAEAAAAVDEDGGSDDAPGDSQPIACSWSTPEKALEQRQFWGVCERCLDAMPPRCAEVLVRKEVMGESIGDICRELGISPTNCSVMLFRARSRLRGCLEQRWFRGAP